MNLIIIRYKLTYKRWMGFKFCGLDSGPVVRVYGSSFCLVGYSKQGSNKRWANYWRRPEEEETCRCFSLTEE